MTQAVLQPQESNVSARPDAPIGDSPVFGFILMGGPLSGALVRDVRLANELARRGCTVHVWWAMDRSKSAELDPSIQQRWLFNGFRFIGLPVGRNVLEAIGRTANFAFADKRRSHWLQRRPGNLKRMMQNLMRCVCDGVEREQTIVRRFARDLTQTRVTHVLPMLEMLCPWVATARRYVSHPVQYLVTFQGYELYSTYARAIGLETQLYARLVETVNQSDWPAIAVSEDYVERVIEDVGVPRDALRAIPPGVPPAKRMQAERAVELLKSRFDGYQPDVPLIAYLGRRDAEKGIDLLLYAIKILRQRGYKFQTAICGPTLWGDHYGELCRQIAEELRCDVMWRRFVPNDVRSALFSLAHCVVYPSIHREPFGMVAAEAAAHGTPAIVPDYGGVACAIEANGEMAGLRFKVWDSGDLADQIARLLDDEPLRRKLADAGPGVAEYYSVENLADRVLAHIGVTAQAKS
ncbi:MAG: glycosyltransferase family 4 protein [Phycisphaerales bacterium]|nr:glycosyltransferase family 4 protein [Phycisphaerales bacterium]MCI0676733.1 glycosyltransferase family 4 protein [Phycisphaerales bacterium]